jgi:methionine-S-sulfoxide reductase
MSDLAPTARQTEVAVLAGGCFWGVEDILRDVPGVIDTGVGYTGGWLENPRYEDTHGSRSGHAEAVRVTFDPAVLGYEELLERWFFRLHDPTTLNRQGNDRGTQYRSAIFPQTREQREAAPRRAISPAPRMPPIARWYRARPPVWWMENARRANVLVDRGTPGMYSGGAGSRCPS